MKKTILKWILLFPAILDASAYSQIQSKVETIFNKMIVTIDNIREYSFQIRDVEDANDKSNRLIV